MCALVTGVQTCALPISSMIRSRGHCNTMGTASTMALVAEALGTVVPGVAGTPAPDSRLLEAAHGTGVLAVEMVVGRAAGRERVWQYVSIPGVAVGLKNKKNI